MEEDPAPLIVEALNTEAFQVGQTNKGPGREGSDLAVPDLEVSESWEAAEVVWADVWLQEELVLADQLQLTSTGQVSLVLRAEVLVVVQAPEEYRDKTMKHFGTAGWQGNLKPIKLF